MNSKYIILSLKKVKAPLKSTVFKVYEKKLTILFALKNKEICNF